MSHRYANIIRRWFEAERGGSLCLPDGWYGRPYDNHHLLSSVNVTEETLVLVLDGILVLQFTNLKSVRSGDHELILGPFEGLHFEAEAFETGEHLVRDYAEGEVKIVSGPGAA